MPLRAPVRAGVRALALWLNLTAAAADDERPGVILYRNGIATTTTTGHTQSAIPIAFRTCLCSFRASLPKMKTRVLAGADALIVLLLLLVGECLWMCVFVCWKYFSDVCTVLYLEFRNRGCIRCNVIIENDNQ